MERLILEAEVRPPQTRGELNRIRLEDKIPAVLYGRGKETVSLIVDGRSLRQLFATGGSNVLIDLKIKEKGKKAKQETVMFKELQRHIIRKETMLHADFIRISMTDKIEVNVQLSYSGEPPGVQDGGVLQILHREVLVKCLPGDIPEHIEIDLSNLSIGDSVSVDSIILADGVELITSPDETLAQVLTPAVEAEAEVEEEAHEEPGEGDEEESAAAPPETDQA